MAQFVDLKDGYLDDVFHVFDAHNHPIVLVEECALMWMGVPANPTDYDFLIRSPQLDTILTALLASGAWEITPQSLPERAADQCVNSVPRLRRTSAGGQLTISLWPENIYFLSVDADSSSNGGDNDDENGGIVPVPNVVAWNFSLVQESLDPGPSVSGSITRSRLEARGTRVVPKVLAQSENTSTIYIPTILRMLEALLDQDRQHGMHTQAPPRSNRVSGHISSLIRALFLEQSHQRDKLLPYISDRNHTSLEARLAGFKRRRMSVLEGLGGGGINGGAMGGQKKERRSGSISQPLKPDFKYRSGYQS
ncbi:hypothetical protein AJ80_03235 [Polytolypa hystricis UAMH7299]|uniref:Uncharacterized protein n=1 Tax=Polytolypa hystricis (strain UAMH7299) TaxID=1447883 RepID=A0A2B7YBK2_POLH7|nr:hypothetical protein AJ80_03235 [Polytolypa hystricis UAMH7299]